MNKRISLVMTASLLLSLLLSITSFAAGTVACTWNSVSFNSDGSASWSVTVEDAAEKVNSYTVKLYRMSNGEDWKIKTTKKSYDDAVDFTITQVGQYKIEVSATMASGKTSATQGASDTVNVTKEDVGFVSYSGSGFDGYKDPYAPKGPGDTVTNALDIAAGPGSSTSTGTPASDSVSGWVKSGDNWYYKYSNGTYAKNAWENVNDKWYYFNQSGIMQTGWVNYKDNWYLCLPTGEMAYGWNNVNEKWYYMNENGIMQTGFITIDGKVYYTDSTGARVQNSGTPDGHYFDDKGVMIR